MTPSATDTAVTAGNDNIPDYTVRTLRVTLTSEEAPLSARFRALFSLKHLAAQTPRTKQSQPALEAIAAAFASPSALLKHELAYCLGQTGNLAGVEVLTRTLRDEREDAMVRHEAAEALGALGHEGSLPLLRERRDDAREESVVRETCEIAVERILWEHDGSIRAAEGTLKESDFASVDPAPPLPAQDGKDVVEALQDTLLDASKPLFLRYRAMFGLRDLASPPDLPTAVPAVLALARGFGDKSPLFRHEIAFVYGQLSHPASIPALVETLRRKGEAAMVRHEAAEALGSLGDEEGVDAVLREFINDPEQVVRESVVVALDMAEFERSGDLEYAIVPVELEAVA